MSKKNSEAPLFDGSLHNSLLNGSEDGYDSPDKTIKLAVSDDIILTKLEVKVMDTNSFQRLRRLKQLGTTHLVYPSAQHTRFEHSLGSLAMADRMIRLIESNEKSSPAQKKIENYEKQIIRLAALLHDIGNIPFGHTLEDELCVITENQDDASRLNKVFEVDPALEKLLKETLGDDNFDLLEKVLVTKKKDIASLGDHAFIYDIVKNTVCADLLDYLKRDAYFCYLNLGFPDRILKYLFLTPYPLYNPTHKRVAIRLWKAKDSSPRQDLVSELIQLLQNRYFVAERIYFHHTKCISSTMLARAVWDAMKNSDPDDFTVEKMLLIGDEELLSMLENSQSEVSSRFVKALKERVLHVRLPYELSREQLSSDKIHDHLKNIEEAFHSNAEERYKIEDNLSEFLGVKKGDVLIYCPDLKMNKKVAEVLVTWKDTIIPLEQMDDELVKRQLNSILSSHERLWKLQVFVERSIRDDENKVRLLKKWVKALIEDGKSIENLKDAIKEQVFAEYRTSNKSIAPAKVDTLVEELVQETRSEERKQFITRKRILEKINSVK